MSVASTAIDFLHHYGYIALFVLMLLETAMILHFVPSELVVAVAAATLATGFGSLALVVAIATLGATMGALLLYAVSRYGGRPFFDRNGKWIGLPPDRLEKMHRLFERPTGESLVFFLRLLPFFRAAVSIPAGIARMDARKFLLFSASGSALFNAAIAYVAFEAGRSTVLAAFLAHQRARFSGEGGEWISAVVLVLLVVGLVWFAIRSPRGAPRVEAHHVFERATRRLVVALAAFSAVFLLAAVWVPDLMFGIVAWLALDFDDLAASLGLSHAVALVWLGLSLLAVALLLLAVARLVRALARAR